MDPNNSSNSEVAAKIALTFESNFPALPPKNQQHWSIRMYRITGSDKYVNNIHANFQLMTLRSLPRIMRMLNEPDYLKIESERIANAYNPKSERRVRRIPVYRAHPETMFIMHVVHYLFVAKSLGFGKQSYFKDVFEKVKVFLNNYNLEELFLSEDLIKVDPSAVANTIYYLEYLDILKVEDKLLQSYKDIWLNFDPQSTIEWQDKIYALTHVIIAGSYFYQRVLETEKFKWILDYFENNLDKIKENTNEDITAEVGLSFKLCGDFENKTIPLVSGFVSSRFDPNLGYVPRVGVNSLAQAEHRNIIAMMLLTDWKELTAGPDLMDFMRKEKRGFYIPEKGQFIGSEPEEE